MRERNEGSAYLEPAEQMVLAAKVNRLCEGEDEVFNETNVNEAREIVGILVPRVQKIGAYFQYLYHSSSTSTVSQGSTSTGEIDASFDGEKETKFGIGSVHEYRVGRYVVTKSKKLGLGEFLIFESFFGRGETNAALEEHGRKTEVIYGRDLNPIRISRFYRKNLRIAGFIFVKWEEKKLWERGRFFLQVSQGSDSA